MGENTNEMLADTSSGPLHPTAENHGEHLVNVIGPQQLKDTVVC